MTRYAGWILLALMIVVAAGWAPETATTWIARALLIGAAITLIAVACAPRGRVPDDHLADWDNRPPPSKGTR